MTTLAAPVLSDAQQMLIDARLDTIDRMLIGRVPREDRLAIVREVESQIQELLAVRDMTATSRDDILDVLRRLDPPEAYLPEQSEGEGYAPRFVNVSATKPVKTQVTGFKSGRLGGILGLSSFGMLFLFPVTYLLVAVTDSEFLVLLAISAHLLMGLGVGVTGFVLSIRGRREGVLPILGIIASALALPMFLLAGLYWLFIIVNM